jgi:hypothetical protein
VGVQTSSISGTTDGKTTFDPARGYLVNDGTNNRVLIGKRNDGSYGIDVSKTGQEVVGASGSQLVMSSQFNAFKIVATGTASFVVPAGGAANSSYYVDIIHNLGFVPGMIAYINSAGTRLPAGVNYALPMIFYGFASGGAIPINALLSGAINSTTLEFLLYTGDVNTQYAGTWSVRYYLTQETAN